MNNNNKNENGNFKNTLSNLDVVAWIGIGFVFLMVLWIIYELFFTNDGKSSKLRY